MVLAAAMVMGCGQNENECEQAADIIMDAYRAACKSQSRCGVCDDCISKGQIPSYDEQNQFVGCLDAEELEEECEGDPKKTTKACVGNAECKENLSNRATEKIKGTCN